MAGETKRIRKPTKQFESWKEGDKHAPDSVRQRKRREKVKGQKKREMLKGKKLQKQGNVVMKDRAEEDLVQNKAKDLGQKSMDLLKGDPPKTKKSKQGQHGFSGVKKTKNKKK
jgi:hypothetical protein